jgi:hypothetical protein
MKIVEMYITFVVGPFSHWCAEWDLGRLYTVEDKKTNANKSMEQRANNIRIKGTQGYKWFEF